MSTSVISTQLRPSLFSSNAADFVCKTCRRNAATQRRTRKALRVRIDPAFAPSKTETQDHIIFNPPSSAPNVYHTPAIFLPKSDPRRALLLTPSSESATPATPNTPTSALAAIAAARRANQSGALPPSVRPEYEKKYHLGQEEIDEIRRLRAEDPRYWSRVRLAEKFDCSQFFVSLCCSSPEMKAEHDQRLEDAKRRWGRRKQEAREDRKIRKEMWGRDA